MHHHRPSTHTPPPRVDKTFDIEARTPTSFRLLTLAFSLLPYTLSARRPPPGRAVGEEGPAGQGPRLQDTAQRPTPAAAAGPPHPPRGRRRARHHLQVSPPFHTRDRRLLYSIVSLVCCMYKAWPSPHTDCFASLTQRPLLTHCAPYVLCFRLLDTTTASPELLQQRTVRRETSPLHWFMQPYPCAHSIVSYHRLGYGICRPRPSWWRSGRGSE